MKKKYVTPMIAVEHYELTQAIANCSVKIGFLDNKCVLKDADSTSRMKDLARKGYFNSECEILPVGMTDPADGFCYHANAAAAFNS